MYLFEREGILYFQIITVSFSLLLSSLQFHFHLSIPSSDSSKNKNLVDAFVGRWDKDKAFCI